MPDRGPRWLFDARRREALERSLYLQLGHDPARAALILGSGRSGTTWLAEALARAASARLLFEPFHPRWFPRGEELRLFLDPAADGGPMRERVARVLSGRERDRHWVDQITITRLSRRRVVKDIHAGNLLPWFRRAFPEVPIVYAIRHPVATALSRRRVDGFEGLAAYLETPAGRHDAERSPVAAWLPAYDEHRANPDSLVRFVAEWCVENAYPLACLERGDGLLTHYEWAVADPEVELRRLADFCAGALGPVDLDAFAGDAARRPSAKDFFGTAAAARESGDWEAVASRWRREVPEASLRASLEVLADFGLAHLYGEGPMPLRSVEAEGDRECDPRPAGAAARVELRQRFSR